MNSYLWLAYPALVSLLLLTGLYHRAWWQKTTELPSFVFWLGRLGGGLLVGSLIWAGVTRQHVPPTGLDEVLLVLSGLLLLLLLKQQATGDTSQGVLAIGFGVVVILLGIGVVMTGRGNIYVGVEPLWLWGLLARWLILLAQAGLAWLALLASLALWCEITKNTALKTTLFGSTAHTDGLPLRWQPILIGLLAVGGSLYWLRDWWGWGHQINRGLGVVMVLLLLLGAEWLRFTSPYRRWWSWSFTIGAFIASLLALGGLAA